MMLRTAFYSVHAALIFCRRAGPIPSTSSSCTKQWVDDREDFLAEFPGAETCIRLQKIPPGSTI
jgi:hypothetical protein